MTEKPISIQVDFNNDDDDDVIRALFKRVSDPGALAVGLPVRLYDGEGNECLGYVVKLDDRSVWAKAEYGTWTQPIRIEPLEQLDRVLADQIRFFAQTDTSATPELVEAS